MSAGQEHRAKTVSLADEDAVKQVLADSILGLWDVVNSLTRLRPARHERFRVSIFGSARARPGTSRMTRRSVWRRCWGRSAATSSRAVGPG